MRRHITEWGDWGKAWYNRTYVVNKTIASAKMTCGLIIDLPGDEAEISDIPTSP